MDPVTSDVLIDRPQGEVFAYLADVSNYPVFMGHFTKGWHVTREDTYGPGAGVRFAFEQRRNGYPWVDATIIEFEPPRRIVLAGRTGKFNRVRALITWELEPGVGGSTRVAVTYETQTKMASDRLIDRRGFQKARWAKTTRIIQTPP